MSTLKDKNGNTTYVGDEGVMMESGKTLRQAVEDGDIGGGGGDQSSYPDGTDLSTILTSIKGILKGNFVLNSEITLAEGQKIYGNKCTVKCGASAKINLVSDTLLEGIVFTYTGSDAITSRTEWEEGTSATADNYRYEPIVSFDDLSGEANSLWGNYFIKISENTVNAGVTGCTFKYFNGQAIRDNASRHFNPDHVFFNNNIFVFCRVGINVIGEFSRIYGNYFHGCIFGMRLQGNNVNAVDNLFIRNDCGIYFPSNNNAHGEISTSEWAHNGLAGIYAKTINEYVGFMFSNCQFAQAAIVAEKAYALSFVGCRIDTYIQISAGARNRFVLCNMRDAYAQTKYGDATTAKPFYNVPSDTQLGMNIAMSTSQTNDKYNTLS